MSSGAARGWPIIGHLAAFRADTTGFLLRMAREQGDVARFRLGLREAFVLAHPRDVRSVLVDRAADFGKGRLMQRARRLLGDGLLTSEGTLHQAQRRRIQPVFTRERVHGFAVVVPDLVARRTARWQHGMRLRLGAEMDSLSMTIVAQTLLGVDIENDLPLLGASLRRLARWAPLLTLPGGRLLERSRLPIIGRLREAIEDVEKVIDQRIDEGGTAAPLLGALLRLGDQGAPMSARLVRDEVMTIFLAGHDTTAAALTWTWLLLANHPDVEAQVYDEVRAAQDDALPYTDMVVKEVLRLYPPIGRIGRRPLCDVTVGGVVLPQGSTVFLSPFVTHRDSRWFPMPDEFRPQRWAEPASERPPFAWFPFGAGPRSCVGEHFARVVMAKTIATIARNWRLRPTRTDWPRTRSLLTLKPADPVSMVAEQRTTPAAGAS
ncbi:MAG: cytochrome P450 [Gemmatimonadales bacterium]